MKRIQFSNFRCHIDKIFDFGNEGLVLITAGSGAGKSTIFMGILFAIYGTGTKLTSFGKTSCKVELDFDNLKIIRTKRPNRLVLIDEKSEYEDDAAQEILNKKFGDTFNVTGYISQNNLNSFIIMSPADKLEFLEKFAFKDVNLQEIKARSKVLINQRHDVLKATMNQLEIVQKVFEELNEPVEVKYPLKGKNTDCEKIMKNEDIRIKNCNTLIKRSRNSIEKLQHEFSEIRVLKTFLQSKDDNIDSLVDKLNNLSIEETNIIYQGDEQLGLYKNKLNNILQKKELILLEDTYKVDKEKLEVMKRNELKKLREEHDKIKLSLWEDYTKDELVSSIKETKDCLKDAKRVSFLKNEIKDCIDASTQTILETKKQDLKNFRIELDEHKQLLDKIIKQKTVYICPSCDNKLHLHDNILCLTQQDVSEYDIKNIKDDILTLQKKIKILEIEIPEEETKLKRKIKIDKEIEDIVSQYEQIDEDTLLEQIEYLEDYYKVNNSNEQRLSKIQYTITSNIFPMYESFEKELSKLETRIHNSREKYNDEGVDSLEFDGNEEELRNVIILEERNKEVLSKLIINKRKLEEEKQKFEKHADSMTEKHVKSFGEVRKDVDVDERISQEKNAIMQKEDDISKHNLNLENIKKYNDFIKDKMNFDSWNKKLKDLQIREVEQRRKYTASVILKEKILQAESIALENIINSINIHAAIYLDDFFVDDPIIVRLLPFKETKKITKPQINIEIQYKDMECDLSTLSGGELSRVVLAYTLALNEMFNTPMIMLDESTASLDQELTITIFDSIKQHFTNKLVLIIAHQTVNGIFDTMIKM